MITTLLAAMTLSVGADREIKTVEAAQREVRKLIAAKKVPKDGLVVELEGTFAVHATIWFRAADGGPDAKAPIVWRGVGKGAFFDAGTPLPEAGFRKVTDGTMRKRFGAVADKVYAFDLASIGITGLAAYADSLKFFDQDMLYGPDGQLTLARTPDRGWLEMGKVVDDGRAPFDRKISEFTRGVRGGVFAYDPKVEAADWDVSTGVYMMGFWCWDWAPEIVRVAKFDREKGLVTTAGSTCYGFGSAHRSMVARRYHYVNFAEGISVPGEWWVNRKTLTLYVYPPEKTGLRGLSFACRSSGKGPLCLSVRESKNLRFENIDFAHSTAPAAIACEASENVTFDRCRVHDCLACGVQIAGGRNCVLSNSTVTDMGNACVTVSGGDRKTLLASGHRVTGCDLKRSGRMQRKGNALSLRGVGNRADHNLIHDTPYIAVSYGGNDNVIEYNEIRCAMLESGDGGALYTGRDWGSQGNRVRYNYIHHLGAFGNDWKRAHGEEVEFESLKKPQFMGVYLDDCDAGDTVEFNLFDHAGWAVFVGGGRYHTVRGNLVLNSTCMIHFDTRGLRRQRLHDPTNREGWDQISLIEQFDFRNGVWAARYPDLIDVMEEEPAMPFRNTVENNVDVNVDEFCWAQHDKRIEETFWPHKNRFAHNASVAKTPGKDDVRRFPPATAGWRVKFLSDKALGEKVAAIDDPRKVQDLPEFQALFPDFERIPVEKIGLGGEARPRRGFEADFASPDAPLRPSSPLSHKGARDAGFVI